ncbi:MAG: single-stranded DNA-binding protein [Actinobacteria bacterium]|nr:MAG: single-stranded DNA-binding protein [Actinomycetota bacterium]
MSINRVMISGNLTRDGELRSTGGGMSVLSLRVAVNDSRKNQSTGEWEEIPNYVGVVIFGKRADSLGRYLTKGTKVAVEGKLRYSEWEKDGQKHSKLEVVADEIEFMSGRGEGGGGSSRGSATEPASADDVADALGGEEVPGEEIPF